MVESFLKHFDVLQECEMDMLAQYEEEQYRVEQTYFDTIFPTGETIGQFG